MKFIVLALSLLLAACTTPVSDTGGPAIEIQYVDREVYVLPKVPHVERPELPIAKLAPDAPEKEVASAYVLTVDTLMDFADDLLAILDKIRKGEQK